MKTTLVRLGGTCYVIATLLLAMPAEAKDKWDYSTEYAATSIPGQTATKFSEYVKELTKGDVEITTHFNGSLGFKSPDNYTAIEDGALQIADTPFNRMNGIKTIFDLQSLPFLQSTFHEARTLDALLRPIYNNVMRKNKQFILYTVPWTPQGFWAKKIINNKDDLTGLKVRVADINAVKTMKAAGASALQMNWSDTVTGATTGAIDAVLTAADTGYSGKLPDAGLKYFTAVGFTIGLEMTHVNVGAFNNLSSDNQIAVLIAADKAQTYGWALAARMQIEILEKMKSEGVTVMETKDVDPQFRTFLQQSAQEAISEWKVKFGPQADNIISTYRSELKTANP